MLYCSTVRNAHVYGPEPVASSVHMCKNSLVTIIESLQIRKYYINKYLKQKSTRKIKISWHDMIKLLKMGTENNMHAESIRIK